MDNSVLSTAFYDVMFPHSCIEYSLFEAEIKKRINGTLTNKSLLSAKLQPLPALQLDLLNLLNSDNVSYGKVAELIQKDPALTLKVLKVVNSAKNSSGLVITNLSTAIARLGMNGVATIASAIMMKSINPPKPIYYKLYGKQIWTHSLQCAYLCKEFSRTLGEDEFLGHFLGLIHDVGKILVFECLVDTLTTTCLDQEIGSEPFRKEITAVSLDVSYFVAREWDLPEVICEALQQQRKALKSPLAKALYAANACSEFYMICQIHNNCDAELPSVVEQNEGFLGSWQEFLADGNKITVGI